jgi:D-3-phosphoglycerate dehydrogenase / 2-oxoglutarate reductase
MATYRVAVGTSSFAQEDDAPLQKLEAADCEVVENAFKRRLTEEEIIAHLKGMDGLIAGLEPLNRRVIAAAPQLKAIARVGIGVTNVDFDAAKDHGVKVSNTPDGPVAAVAEMTLTALLSLARRLIRTNEALHRKEWTKSVGMGLLGAKVLFLGYGRIGQKTAQLLRAFGAEVAVYDPYINAASLTEGEAYVSDLHAGLAGADVVTLHASGTNCILGGDEFAVLKKGVILLNSARGELVEEAALVHALESGTVGGAWFDAFWQEPYTGPLCDFDQVLLTPHVGTYTRQCRLGMESAAVDNLLRDLQTK